jgi:hypothetical protein
MTEWIEDPQGRAEVEKVTKELKLPVWKANYKGKFRDFWNELWDKIEDNFLKLKKDTGDKSKELENRLASAVGRDDGDFPIANAVVGDVYYSALTKKYYKCKVGGPAPMPNGNFVDLSVLENLNRLENLISSKTEGYNSILKIGNVVIENISIPGSTGIRTAKLKTSFKNIIFVSLTPYITYGQEVDSAQVLHDNNEYIIKNKSLRFYCNGHQTVDICVIGLI